MVSEAMGCEVCRSEAAVEGKRQLVWVRWKERERMVSQERVQMEKSRLWKGRDQSVAGLMTQVKMSADRDVSGLEDELQLLRGSRRRL